MKTLTSNEVDNRMKLYDVLIETQKIGAIGEKTRFTTTVQGRNKKEAELNLSVDYVYSRFQTISILQIQERK